MTRAMLTAVLALVAPTLAHADAIYGCWTNGAEQLVVDYERVITPGGASPEAQIDRHNAVYMAPEGERDAGRLLAFRQMNHTQVMRTVWAEQGGEEAGEREVWGPCEIQLNS